MGKRKVKSEEALKKMVLPSVNDVLGVASKVLGAERFLVKCQDGKERLCRIRGKMKRRAWVREGDIVLVSPWDFQSDRRGDIFWRYRKNGFETKDILRCNLLAHVKQCKENGAITFNSFVESRIVKNHQLSRS
jgi:translation initiation factor 1A